MNISNVILLEEAVDDLEVGCQFYEQREAGIGTYFVESALAIFLPCSFTLAFMLFDSGTIVCC